MSSRFILRVFISSAIALTVVIVFGLPIVFQPRTCSITTWPIFVEANPAKYKLIIPRCECSETYRSLHLTYPHLSGYDVAELQERLLALGFFSGEVDGVFGPSN